MLNKVVVLAAFTPRSQAYLQALAQAGTKSLVVLAYGPVPQPGETPLQDALQVPTRRAWQGVALPDLSESIQLTCKRAGWELLHCPERDVDALAVRAVLRGCAPQLVVYSGYGGQIVGKRLLDASAPFLHVHAGALPRYRGSTTAYYSILERRECAASAFLLRTGIDTGPLVAQRRYPLPPRGMDVDRVYDAAIRADLLLHALDRLRSGLGPTPQSQQTGEGHTYYVIHPVLKHLALLSLPTTGQQSEPAADRVSENAA